MGNYSGLKGLLSRHDIYNLTPELVRVRDFGLATEFGSNSPKAVSSADIESGYQIERGELLDLSLEDLMRLAGGDHEPESIYDQLGFIAIPFNVSDEKIDESELLDVFAAALIAFNFQSSTLVVGTPENVNFSRIQRAEYWPRRRCITFIRDGRRIDSGIRLVWPTCLLGELADDLELVRIGATGPREGQVYELRVQGKGEFSDAGVRLLFRARGWWLRRRAMLKFGRSFKRRK